ncbi:hypothetical protein C7S18_12170 [Ahniella affigens]|uniref:Capsid protein n=1 Tax=Ahniella affigens TaxID=2021234 RepID=A0A2P1PSS8_9GAMM|nr:major capsid protein [Ahniella affigens]AVP97907.1 hypothetical protein C7S18_12170 [Ahniella affigens]
MSQQTPAQARVIDPILSQHARGYKSPQTVGAYLFPRVYVKVRGGKIIKFGKEAFKLYQTARAPGTATKRIQFGYSGDNYGLGGNSLEAVVPIENQQEAITVPGIDLASSAVNITLRSMALAHEYECATLSQNAANYDSNHKVALTGSARWNDGASTPAKNVLSWRDAVRATTGVEPNVMVIGPKVFNALADHPAIQDRFKYTGRDSITTKMLAALFEVDNVWVGKAIMHDEATGDFTDIWGKNVVMAYVPVSESPTKEEPSYGYTYTLEGHPSVAAPYYENNIKSWCYPVDDDRQVVLTGITSGFLAQTVVD